MSETNETLQSLRSAGKLTARQAGGQTVSAFFERNKGALAARLSTKAITPDRLLKTAQDAIRASPSLLQCSMASLFAAVAKCAVIGLEPNTHEQHCWLIPRKRLRPLKDANGKNAEDSDGKWIWETFYEVHVQIGYQGYIALAYRNPKVRKVTTHIIHQGDRFKIIEGTSPRIEHEARVIDDNGNPVDQGQPIIYYAVAKLDNGETPFEWMSVSAIERIRDEFSDSYNQAIVERDEAVKTLHGNPSRSERNKALSKIEKADDAAWIRDFDEMARKTVFRRLRKWLPPTHDLAAAAALEDTQDFGEYVIEGEVVEETQTQITDKTPPHQETKSTTQAQITQEQSGQTVDQLMGKPKETVSVETETTDDKERVKQTAGLGLNEPTPWYENVGLTGRAVTAAQKAAKEGVVTLEQALTKTEDWWLSLPGVGLSSVSQIMATLDHLRDERGSKDKPVKEEQSTEEAKDTSENAFGDAA